MAREYNRHWLVHYAVYQVIVRGTSALQAHAYAERRWGKEHTYKVEPAHSIDIEYNRRMRGPVYRVDDIVKPQEIAA